MNDNEKILACCVVTGVIGAAMMAMCLVPNGPRLIKTLPSYEAETKPTLASKSPVKRNLGFFEVTAYCPCELCCGDWSDGMTASGYVIRPGDLFVAADPTIPFGKVLDVPGYGVAPVLDRGGAITGKKLDVFFPTHVEALEWGRRTIEIYCWVGK